MEINKAVKHTNQLNKNMKKPCPFCQNEYTNEYDSGGACCFCDYSGLVTIGPKGMFKDIDKYNKVYFASNHNERLDEIHGRNDLIKIVEDLEF